MTHKLLSLIYILCITIISNAQHIGDPNRTPDIYVPSCETNWQDIIGCYGVRKFTPTIKSTRVADSSFAKLYDLNIGDTCAVILYACPIVNGASTPTSGDYSRNDFVICRSCDGKVSPKGGYDFPGLISVLLFKDGSQVGGYNKTNYWFSVTDFSGDLSKYSFNNLRYYNESDTMYIWCGTSDMYYNYVAIKTINGNIPDGYYVIKIHLNPLRYITESNYDNDITLLPLKISNNVVEINDSAVLLNQPQPVNNLSGTVIWGANKYVDLKWSSRTDETYTIYKNGIKIGSSSSNTFRDTNLSNGFKMAVYTVYTTIDGLGTSKAANVTVKR